MFISTESIWKCKVCGHEEKREPPPTLGIWVALHNGGCMLSVLLIISSVFFLSVLPDKWKKWIIIGEVSIVIILIALITTVNFAEKRIQNKWYAAEEAKPCAKCNTANQWDYSSSGGII